MDFLPIRTSTLRPNTELLFDVYVEFQDTHLKYRSASERLDDAKLSQFKAKKIKKVFIPSAQEPRYLAYLDQALSQLQDKSMEVADRAEFARDTLRRESENMGKALESEETYRASEDRIYKVVDFVMGEPKALATMLSEAGIAVDDSAHGSTVASLCMAVGAGSKKLVRDELTEMAIAALLHDTALAKLGFDANTDLEALPKDSRASFRKHAAAAAELVAGKQFITPRVLRIIEDHEEFGDGLGFPNKKNLAKLEMDSRVFNLCDAFNHFCIRRSLQAVSAVESFVEERGGYFDLDLLQVLEKSVKAT